MSIMGYYFIDGIALTTLCYTMTLSKPLAKLQKEKPSASLLGPSTVASTLGFNGLAFLCLISALCLMTNDPDYIRWPSNQSNAGQWWNISDNWESTVLYVVMYMFLISSAGIYSFGHQFREGITDNFPLLINLTVLFVLTTLLTLMDPNGFTDYWHMASYPFNQEGTTSPIWAAYQLQGGKPSPGMSIQFRLKLYFLVIGFIVAAAFWQAEVMEGAIAEMIRNKYNVSNNTNHKNHKKKLKY